MARISPENPYLSSLVTEAQASRERGEAGARLIWLHQAGLDWDATFDVDPHQVTAVSYDAFANEYSSKEWGLDLVDVVWSEVFRRYFEYLQALEIVDGQRPRVLLSGVGTGRDPVIVALLNKSLDVVAYDKSPSMLARAEERLSWEDISTLGHFLGRKEPELNGWISEIRQLMGKIDHHSSELGQFEEQIASIFSNFDDERMGKLIQEIRNAFSLIKEVGVDLQDKVLDHLHQRLILEQNNHLSINYPPGSFDAIFDIATLQHLDKMTGELDEAIARKLDLLTVGGQYHFSLRLDKEPLRMDEFGAVVADTDLLIGRTFSDNSLNPLSTSPQNDKGWRYYSSISTQEVQYLIRKIESGALTRLTPAVVPHNPTTPRPQFKVVEVWESSTLTYHKPSFINFRVVRVS
jgi:SAM-dependent methyltransferase